MILPLLLLLAGCASLKHPGKSGQAFGSTQAGGTAHRVSEAELQEDLLRFESQFNAGIQNSDRVLEESRDPRIRFRAALNRLIYSTNSLGIATGPSPEANLLDMVTFVELSRDVLEKHWVPEFFGAAGNELVETFHQASLQIWRIAGKVLEPKQAQVLERIIRRWRKNHPEQINVETVRLSAFAYQAGLSPGEDEEIGGLFASVQQATEAADSARLFAERALYYAERAPTLLRLQAKIGTHEMMGEVGSSLTQFQDVLHHEGEIAALLREVTKTLQVVRPTLVEANSTVSSLGRLIEQQSKHPEIGKRSLETIVQLTALLRQWNGTAAGVEQGGNRMLLRSGGVGAALIALFWALWLVSKLAYLHLSRRIVGQERHEDQRRDRAA